MIDQSLALEVGDRIETALRAVIEGDQDGDGIQDRYAIDCVRVAVVRPESSKILQGYFGRQEPLCPQLETPYASYAWYPYGFSDDPDRFI